MRRPTLLALLLAITTSVLSSPTAAQTVRDSSWITDGTVLSIVGTGTRTFVGGYFSRVGPYTGGLATMNTATCIPESRTHTAGLIRIAIPDGTGGWYVAGDFSSYDGQPRSGLARLDSNGDVMPWNPLVTGTGSPSYVNAMVLSHGKLYLGGRFTAIGAQPCAGLAAVDTATAEPDGWAPDAKLAVAALAVSGDTLHAGGSFRSIGTELRPGLASFDLGSGALLSPALPGPQTMSGGTGVTTLAAAPGMLYAGGTIPYIGAPTGGAAVVDTVTGQPRAPLLDILGSVRTVIPDGAGGWYVGGAFSHIRGLARVNLAHVDADGVPSAWSPAPNDTVRALLLKGDTLFVAGSFTITSATARNGFAAYRASTGELLAGTPGADAPVHQLALSGTRLILGGSFTTLGGFRAPSLAALDCEMLTLSAIQPWYASGVVNSLVAADDKVYVGGSFQQVRSNTPYFLLADSTGHVAAGTPTPTSSVEAILPDGAGGWYVGGGFSSLGVVTRRALAHILADGSVDAAFDAHIEGISAVMALAMRNDTLYAGGTFSVVNGVARTGIAALNAATGALLPWNPVLNGNVRSIALAPGTIYLNGGFSSAGGQARGGLAAVDAATGAVTSWNPVVSSSSGGGSVSAVAYADNVVYIGGLFTNVGAISRSCFAALDPVTAAPLPLNLGLPVTTSIVNCIAVSGDRLYVGGRFTSVLGHARTNLACVDLSTGSALTFAPNPNGWVRALSIVGDQLYVGGDFGFIGGLARRYAAQLNAATGSAQPFSLGLDQQVRAIGRSGALVAVGGIFTTSDSLVRNRLMAFDPVSGVPTSFAPSVNGEVRALALAGDLLYVGGQFTSIAGISRVRVGAVNVNGTVAPWAPNPPVSVYAIGVYGSRIYVGGEKASGGYLYGYDRTTGLLSSWNPNPNGAIRFVSGSDRLWVGGNCAGIGGWTRSNVFAIATATAEPTSFAPRFEKRPLQLTLSGSTLYAGGAFTAINDTARYSMAAFNTSTGQMLPWNPDVRTTVNSFSLSGDTLFAGGAFTTAGGSEQKCFAALSATTGALLGIRSSANGTVQTVSVSGGRLLASGSFTSIGMQPRSALAAFGPDGEALPWNAGLSGTVNTLALSGDRLYAGGSLWRFDAPARNYAAAFDTATAQVLPWAPEPDGMVQKIAPNGGTVYLGGEFANLGTVPRRDLAEVDTSLGVPTSWNPSPNGLVTSVARQGSRVFVGGMFTTIGGQSRQRIASVDASSGLADSWNPGANGRVNALVATDTDVFVGGTFTTIAGQSRRVLAALDPVTGAMRPWNPGINSTASSVSALDLRNGWLFVGGVFASFGGGTHVRQHLAALDPVSAVPFDWVANASAEVMAIAHAGDRLWIGGFFTTVAGRSRLSLAALTDPTWQLELLDAPPAARPGALSLAQNFPNPFRGASSIRFALPKASVVRLALFDLQGREAVVLLDGVSLPAGTHEVPVHSTLLRAGVYWYQLSTGGESRTRRLVALP